MMKYDFYIYSSLCKMTGSVQRAIVLHAVLFQLGALQKSRKQCYSGVINTRKLETPFSWRTDIRRLEEIKIVDIDGLDISMAPTGVRVNLDFDRMSTWSGKRNTESFKPRSGSYLKMFWQDASNWQTLMIKYSIEHLIRKGSKPSRRSIMRDLELKFRFKLSNRTFFRLVRSTDTISSHGDEWHNVKIIDLEGQYMDYPFEQFDAVIMKTQEKLMRREKPKSLDLSDMFVDVGRLGALDAEAYEAVECESNSYSLFKYILDGGEVEGELDAKARRAAEFFRSKCLDLKPNKRGFVVSSQWGSYVFDPGNCQWRHENRSTFYQCSSPRQFYDTIVKADIEKMSKQE